MSGTDAHLTNGQLSSRPQRVLIAEDDLLLANTVDEFLRDQGYTVRVAIDGEAALLEAVSFELDVLLTDLRMPRMEGGELIRRLRITKPGLPVVVMSGNAPADLKQSLHGPGAGPVAIIHKPMRLLQLLQALRQVLDVPLVSSAARSGN
jgi:CheY-like chemotaxis protein